MAQQSINLGAEATGIGGDTWRSAFVKCNDNFTDLYSVKLNASANAVSATKLVTARTINGTSFNGTGNITTSNWGTTRTLTIGSSGKSVNGSANVAWSLAEMGAIAIGDAYTDSFEPSVTYISSSATAYTTMDDLPIGRALVSTSNTASNIPSCNGDSFAYIETKSTYLKGGVGRVQFAIGYTNGHTEVRSRGSDNKWSAWKRYAFASDVLALTGGTVTGVTRFNSSIKVKQYIDLGNSETTDAVRGLVFYGIGSTQKGQINVDTDTQMNFLHSSAYAFDSQIKVAVKSATWLGGLSGSGASIALDTATASNYHAWIQQIGTGGTGYAIGLLNDSLYISGITASNIANAKNSPVHILQSDLTKVTFTLPVVASSGVTGALTGNADTATKLKTARTIQGVSFDGSANITLPTFTTGADGLVPARSGSTTTKYLREDGTWVAPPNTNTTYSGMSDAEVTAGTGTTARLITPVALKTAITTHAPVPSVFTTDVAGLVPARSGTTSTKYLREDGTWVVPANTTYGAMSSSEATTGTATSSRVISAATLKAAIVAWSNPVDDALLYAPIAYPGATPPSGYLALMGQAITSATYPKLYAMYGAKLPDMRAYSIRGLDYGRGIDTNRTVLSTQEDAMQQITGSFSTRGNAGYYDKTLSGAFYLTNTAKRKRSEEDLSSGTYDGVGDMGFDSSLVARTATETRVKNVAFLYIVKAG